jgi:hypothetical protein
MVSAICRRMPFLAVLGHARGYNPDAPVGIIGFPGLRQNANQFGARDGRIVS